MVLVEPLEPSLASRPAQRWCDTRSRALPAALELRVLGGYSAVTCKEQEEGL